MTIKRKQIAYNSKSSVAFNKKRNPKDILLWRHIDTNTDTTNVILPDREKGGSVLKLGLFNGSSSITDGEFPVKSKLNAHFVGNGSNMIEETANTSTSGESLCFTIVFKTSSDVSANADISTHVNIIIHESGHSYKVGDEITLDGQQFVGPPTNNVKFGKPCADKNLIVKVLAVNK
tara:strand:+ start:1111 stop:1638 length:528 start_codon:yes stop_codon:yes gene_type:complete